MARPARRTIGSAKPQTPNLPPPPQKKMAPLPGRTVRRREANHDGGVTDSSSCWERKSHANKGCGMQAAASCMKGRNNESRWMVESIVSLVVSIVLGTLEASDLSAKKRETKANHERKT